MTNSKFEQFEKLQEQWETENSLFRRLKPELIKTLNEHLDQYPFSTQELIDNLDKTVYIRDLRYGDVLDLQLKFRTDNVYVLFDDRERFKNYLTRNGYDLE